MTTTKDGGWKRRLERDDSIYFVFHGYGSKKCAALFQLNITTTKENDLIILDRQLQLIQTFFEKHRDMRTNYVACAHLGSGKYLFMPNESENKISLLLERRNPYVFDSVSKSTYTLGKRPLAQKFDPIAASVGNKVYVLSRRLTPFDVLLEPSFEAFDLQRNEWETLTAPIYIKNTPHDPSPSSPWGWRSEGYAVFQEFIITCFWKLGDCISYIEFHSYNTLSGEWKPVSFTTTPLVVHPDNGCTNLSHDDDSPTNDYQDDCNDEWYEVHYHYDDDEYFLWHGEAVVIRNFIYAYSGRSQGIVAYNCAREISDGCDILSFDEKIYVEACEIRRDWIGTDVMDRSGAVGKIGDDLICMVQTYFSKANIATSQPVHLIIFRALEGGRCCRLKSFELSMPGSELFDLANIRFCFVLPPEVASNMEHGERTPMKRALYNAADDGDEYGLAEMLPSAEEVMTEMSMA